MQKKKLCSSSVPSYVSIYNSLYLDIINNVYPQGELLPGEIQLSQKYSVSRNTLRQALAILSEDGLIVKSRGKGTVVANRDEKMIPKHFFNPMTTFCRQHTDDVEIQFNYSTPTDIARDRLFLSKSEIVLASYLIYKAQSTVVGYSFIQIPVKALEALEIDVSDGDSIYELLSTTLYEKTSSQSLHIKLIYANEMEAEFLLEPVGKPLILIESILTGADDLSLARCKYYFIPEYYSIQYLIR
ncbi:MAG: GntR family transcriptional regulator [Eubacteriales bacterium]|nr:GntR family transcriptional regulator [Eubacteriales bacterium]